MQSRISMKISASLLLALTAACLCLQAAQSFPIQQTGPSDLRANILSERAGQYVKVMEDGAVRATGSPTEASSLWYARNTGGSDVRLENEGYSEYFLAVTRYNNRTLLVAHNISQPLTVSSLGQPIASRQSSGVSSASGSGGSETEATPVDDEVLPFVADWRIEFLNALTTRFRLLTDSGECFLAFNDYGVPVDDFCSITDSQLTYMNYTPQLGTF